MFPQQQQQPPAENGKVLPIFLIDGSGSTTDKWRAAHDKKIFDVECEIVQRIMQENNDVFCHLLFWNAPQTARSDDGVYILEFPVALGSVKHSFMIANQTSYGTGLTAPFVAFRALQDRLSSWFDSTGNKTRIYYVSDGDMNWRAPTGMWYSTYEERMKNVTSVEQLTIDSIKSLFERYPATELQMYTVENRNIDLSEAANNLAGTDVFRLLQQNQLTGKVTKFVTHALNYPNGYTQLEQVIAPPGTIPYGSRYFLPSKLPEFIAELRQDIRAHSNDENYLVAVMQKLAATVAKLTQRCGLAKKSIELQFAKLFDDTCLDKTFTQGLILQTISQAAGQAAAGNSQLFSDMRNSLKNKFKLADQMLGNDVGSAVGWHGNEYLYSIPQLYDNTWYVVAAHPRLATAGIRIKDTLYPSCGVLEPLMTPLLPSVLAPSDIEQQCTRQWFRAIAAAELHLYHGDDILLYYSLGCVLLAHLCQQPKVAEAYRNLAECMFRKKRYNDPNVTEMDRLERGEQPMPNIAVNIKKGTEQFRTMIEFVCNRLGITLVNGQKPRAFTAWYAMCKALRPDGNLAKMQRIHCNEDLSADGVSGNADNGNFLVVGRNLQLLHKSGDAHFDYQCLITLDDLTATGGWGFVPHESPAGQHCAIIHMVSDKGRDEMLARPDDCLCPVCYARLDESSFRRIQPLLPEAELKIDDTMKHAFERKWNPNYSNKKLLGAIENGLRARLAEETAVEEKTTTTSQPPQQTYSARNTRIQPRQQTSNSNKKLRDKLVYMVGGIASGKTTAAKQLKSKLEAKGCDVIVEGTDKYCKAGVPMDAAVGMVRSALTEFSKKETDRRRVIIIDTCGNNTNVKNVFGVNLSGWKKHSLIVNRISPKTCDMYGYLAWTMRNALRRSAPGEDDDYCLNPETAGLETVLEVHAKKAKHLANSTKLPPFANNTKDGILQEIEAGAALYEQELAQKLPLEKQLELAINEICCN